jgi:hypothetical protein
MLLIEAGSCADYGLWNKWILIIASGTSPSYRTSKCRTCTYFNTVICWAGQFGFIGITVPSQWQAAMALYIVCYIAYGVTLVFYASIFPRLARNTPKTKDARASLDRGEISSRDYEEVEMLERNRLSSISTAHSNCESGDFSIVL